MRLVAMKLLQEQLRETRDGQKLQDGIRKT